MFSGSLLRRKNVAGFDVNQHVKALAHLEAEKQICLGYFNCPKGIGQAQAIKVFATDPIKLTVYTAQ